jgi:hypothetical protein
MTLDNGKKIILFRLIGFISTVVYVLYIFIAYFPRVFRNLIPVNYVHIMTTVITLIYIVLLFWPAIMRYTYIFFSADEKGIIFRWYKTGLMPGESKSIEIPADKFAGYELTTRNLGLYHYLTLYQRIQGQKAAYKPVSITALSKSQRASIVKTLNNYISAV